MRNPAALPRPAGQGAAEPEDGTVQRRILLAAAAGRGAEATALAAALECMSQAVRRSTCPCGWGDDLLPDANEMLF